MAPKLASLRPVREQGGTGFGRISIGEGIGNKVLNDFAWWAMLSFHKINGGRVSGRDSAAPDSIWRLCELLWVMMVACVTACPATRISMYISRTAAGLRIVVSPVRFSIFHASAIAITM